MPKTLSKFAKNLHFKVLALLLGFSFWYLIQGEQILEISRKLKITLTPLSTMMLRGENTFLRDITLSGPRHLLGQYPKDPLEVRHQLHFVEEGVKKIRLDKHLIPNWNPQIKLIVHEPYLKIFIEKRLKKTLKVKEHLQGIPHDGFMIEKIKIEPETISLTGLKSELASLEQINTEAIDLQGLKKSTTFTVKLELKELKTKTISEQSVKVFLKIGEKKSNQSFYDIPIELEGKDESFTTIIKPEKVMITLQATPGILKFTQTSKIRAFIDLRNLSPGRHERKVQVKIPSETALIEIKPEKVLALITTRQ